MNPHTEPRPAHTLRLDDVQPGLMVDIDGDRLTVDWVEDGMVGASMSDPRGTCTLELSAHDFVRLIHGMEGGCRDSFHLDIALRPPAPPPPLADLLLAAGAGSLPDSRLAAELRTLWLDASRYRWLRDVWLEDNPTAVNLCYPELFGLDMAIDTEREKC